MKIYVVSNSDGEPIFVSESVERLKDFCSVPVKAEVDTHLQIWQHGRLQKELWLNKSNLENL
jgi:hypothetical protein